jgi:hypothetical protein
MDSSDTCIFTSTTLVLNSRVLLLIDKPGLLDSDVYRVQCTSSVTHQQIMSHQKLSHPSNVCQPTTHSPVVKGNFLRRQAFALASTFLFTGDTCLYLFTLGTKSQLAFGNDLDIDFIIRYLQNLITELEKFLLCSGIGMTARN